MAGNSFFIWRDSRVALQQVYTQRLDANGSPQLVANGVQVSAATASAPIETPSVCTDWQGGWLAAWIEFRGAAFGVYAQRFNASGTAMWGAGGVLVRALTTGPTNGGVRIAGDRVGGAFVIWPESNAPRRVRLTRLTSTGAQASGWTAGGTVLSTVTDNAGWPSAPIVPTDGYVYVAWLHPDTANTTFPQLRVQKFAIGSETALWAADGVNLGEHGGSLTTGLAACSDGAGGMIGFTNTFGAGNRLVAKHVDSAGAVAWTTPFISTTEGFFQFCVSDGAGGAIVAYSEGTLFGVKCSRVTSAGVVSWTTTLTSSMSPNEVANLIGVSDGLNGAIFAWGSSLGETKPDLYIQRVDGTGATMFGASPLLVSSTSSNKQALPWLCSDGANGAIVAFVERVVSSSTDQIYAHRIGPTGGLLWGSAIGVVTAAGQQTTPYVALDDADFGGAPAIIVPPVAANSRAGLELNIRYLIDDLDKDRYSISSPRLHAMMNAAMHLIANRTLLEQEAVLSVPLVAGTYDYALTGTVEDVRQAFLTRPGLELERMEFDVLNATWGQDSNTPLLRGTPRFYALWESSAQVTYLRVAPTPNAVAVSMGPLKVYHSLIPAALTLATSTVPFPATMLRILERTVAAEAVSVMSPEDRKARMLGVEQVKEWTAMVEQGIREENFRLRVASGATQGRILETADQWR